MRKSPAPSRGLPVIIGDYEHAIRHIDMLEEPYSMDEQLAALSKLDFPRWVEEQRTEHEDEDPSEQLKVYPKGVTPMTALSVGRDYQGKARPEVFIAYVPTDDPTLIPLHLRFGDWNACPSPFIHAAAARSWAPRFGARILTMTGDVIEYEVSRPPQSEAEAMELAWQQYLYCPDIVDQGVGSVATLAKALQTSSRWYFWWD